MYFEHGIHIQKLYLESAEQQGVLGYIARSAIDAILSGEQTDLSDAVFVYCPTGYLELLRLQDRFVHLPEMPYREVDLDQAARNVLSQEQFALDGGEGEVASWRNTVTVENVHPNTTVAFRMNNLSGSAAELKLYGYGADGKLAEVGNELWSITDETGAAVDTLSDGTLYELRVSIADGGALDLSEAEKEIKISVVLAK